jgi:hypothetical protein
VTNLFADSGSPRDAAFAEVVACGCCGSFGTQKVQPEFDEHGERLPDDVVAAKHAVAAQERAAARAAALVEQPAQPKLVKEAARTSARQPSAQVLPQVKPSVRERKQAAASTLASLF